MNSCSSCGSPTAPTDRFCSGCGVAVDPVPPAHSHPAPALHARRSDATLIVLIVVVILVVSAAIPTALYLLVVWKPTPPPPYRVYFGMTVTKSPDGSRWILTFTAVPSGMDPPNTSLSLTTSTSVQALPPTVLSSLPEGDVPLSDSLGSLYLAFNGSFPGMIVGGNSVVIGTSTTTGAATAGYTAYIHWTGTTYFADWSSVLH